MDEREMQKKPAIFIQQPPLPFKTYPAQYIYRLSVTPPVVQAEEENSQQSPVKEEGRAVKNKKTIIAIEEGDGNKEQSVEVQVPEIDEERQSMLRDTLRRLSLYPHVLQRPFCEAEIHGEKVVFQVIGKRGDLIRIKQKKEIKTVNIDEIKNFKILQ